MQNKWREQKKRKGIKSLYGAVSVPRCRSEGAPLLTHGLFDVVPQLGLNEVLAVFGQNQSQAAREGGQPHSRQ